jgi:hypothetical protein
MVVVVGRQCLLFIDDARFGCGQRQQHLFIVFKRSHGVTVILYSMCSRDLLVKSSVQFQLVSLFLTMVFPTEMELCSMESSRNPSGLVHGIHGEYAYIPYGIQWNPGGIAMDSIWN